MKAAAIQVGEVFGGLDIFFANAGVAHASPLAETDERLYDEMMDINIKGLLLDAGGLADPPRGGSVILNTSFINQVGFPGLSVLAASKAAVRSLARSWSRELLDRKIRVNAMKPGSNRHADPGQVRRHAGGGTRPESPVRDAGARRPPRDVGGDRRGDPVPGERRVPLHRRRRIGCRRGHLAALSPMPISRGGSPDQAIPSGSWLYREIRGQAPPGSSRESPTR